VSSRAITLPAAGGVALAALAAAGGAAAVAAGGERGFLVATMLAAAAAGAYVAARSEPAWLLAAGIAFSVFSGNTSQLGLPLGPDRVLLAAGLFAVVIGDVARRQVDADPARRLPRPTFTHGVLVAASIWAAASAARHGTLMHVDGAFGLLDRFGFVPFAMYFVAPLAFATERQRAILLGTLVALGAYLGATALFEGLGLTRLVFPSYINDPAVGIHYGRARGPFVEAVANGMGLFMCATAAAVGLATWRRPRLRLACWAVIALCSVGLLLTLTRSIWLSSVVAAVAAFLVVPRLRWWLLPAAAVVVLAVSTALAMFPALHAQVNQRSTEQSSVWVRKNTSRAALEMIRARPVTGFGWQTFQTQSAPYFRQAADYPPIGVGQGVHNIFLGNAAELGIPGAALWLAGLVLAIGGALVRRAPPGLGPWRAALLAIALEWLIVANLTPLPWAFPTVLLWTWAGVLGAGRAWGGGQRAAVNRNVFT
jgi:putative inorganic carbon (hco3(-)) transporter